MNDFHIHSRYSHDSTADMEEYIKRAIGNGMKAICFTEHLDFYKTPPGYKKYVPDDFFLEFESMREKYESDICICAGVEAGEPHVYPEQFAAASGYPYDFILGSIHWGGNIYFGKARLDQYSSKEFFELYWKEILGAVKHGGFDALAHIDLPGRDFPEMYYTEAVMKEIFYYLLDRNAVLEINTSSLRRGIGKSLIDGGLLELYRDCGGRYVTIGSDAHRVQDMGAGCMQARELAQRHGLREVIFRSRQIIEL